LKLLFYVLLLKLIHSTKFSPLKKVRILEVSGHMMYLDSLLQVVVTDLNHPTWKYYFPCGQWLAKDEGDKAICRDLIGSKDPLAMRKSEYSIVYCLNSFILAG